MNIATSEVGCGTHFSRLKELFGLAKNRFVGIKKVAVHVFACLIAYWISYA
ncbi:MAG: hypothetical protein QXS17_03130 [Candidatus Micrarchaeaceae archaeon]